MSVRRSCPPGQLSWSARATPSGEPSTSCGRCFPASPNGSVNPALTIMANAYGVAEKRLES